MTASVYDIRQEGCAVSFRVREEKDCCIVHFLDERGDLMFTNSWYRADSSQTKEEFLRACEGLARWIYDDKKATRL